ncbi:MAG: VOC family protein [Myxococcota bacterium]
MKPPPQDWPRISTSIFYDDAAAAIDWLGRAFGFETRLRIEGEGGRIEHSELVFGGGLVMVSSTGKASNSGEPLPGKSPRSIDGINTQVMCIYVDDVDAHCERARAAGAKIAYEPTTTDYGDDYWSDRSYRAVDPEGHHWWFMQRLRGPSTGES